MEILARTAWLILCTGRQTGLCHQTSARCWRPGKGTLYRGSGKLISLYILTVLCTYWQLPVRTDSSLYVLTAPCTYWQLPVRTDSSLYVLTAPCTYWQLPVCTVGVKSQHIWKQSGGAIRLWWGTWYIQRPSNFAWPIRQGQHFGVNS